MKKLFRTIIILLFCIVLLFLYALKVEPYLFVVKDQLLQTPLNEPLTIVQISDIQICENYNADNFKKIVERINNIDPDICIFTGDLYENFAHYGRKDDLIQALSSIDSQYGNYAIWGNRDYGGGASREYEEIMESSGFQILRNDAVSIPLTSGQTLLIGGLDDALLGKPDIDPILEKMEDSDTYRLLMLHEPDIADSYANAGFDLILSGHSHGGQVYIPFFPTMTTVLSEKYSRGWYDLDSETGTRLYVNSGIGTSRYPVRFLTPPEITFFQLEPY